MKNSATEGGAMYLTINKDVPLVKEVLCVFEGNTATANGIDVYVNDLRNSATKIGFFENSMTKNIEENTLYHFHGTTGEVKKGAIPYGETTRIIAITGGSKEDECGYTGKDGCLSISVAFEKFKEGIDQYASLEEGTYTGETTSINPKAKFCCVSGKNKEKSIYKTGFTAASKGGFVIDDDEGSLSFSTFTLVHDSKVAAQLSVPLVSVSKSSFSAIDCVFKPDDAHNVGTSFETTLFLATNGSLAFDRCTIKSFHLINRGVVLLKEKAGNLQLKATTISTISITGDGDSDAAVMVNGEGGVTVNIEQGSFDSCSSKGTFGSALKVIINDSGTTLLTLKETAFTKNTNPETGGKGAAIYIEDKHKGTSTVPVTFTLTTFKDNKGELGKDIYIKCDQLEQIPDEGMFDMDLVEIYDVPNLIQIECDEVVTDLLIDSGKQMKYKSSEVVLSSVFGAEFGNRCGTTKHPCNNWNLITAHMIPGETQTIKIQKELEFNTEATLTHLFNLVSDSTEQASLILGDAFESTYGGVIHPLKSLKIERMIMDYPNTFETKGTRVRGIVIGIDEGVVIELTSVTFKPRTESDKPSQFAQLYINQNTIKATISKTVFDGNLNETEIKMSFADLNGDEEDEWDESDNAPNEVCLWTADNSLVYLDGVSDATFSDCLFKNSMTGGLFVTGTKATTDL